MIFPNELVAQLPEVRGQNSRRLRERHVDAYLVDYQLYHRNLCVDRLNGHHARLVCDYFQQFVKSVPNVLSWNPATKIYVGVEEITLRRERAVRHQYRVWDLLEDVVAKTLKYSVPVLKVFVGRTDLLQQRIAPLSDREDVLKLPRLLYVLVK